MKKYYVTAKVVDYLDIGTVTANSQGMAAQVAYEKYGHLLGTEPTEDVMPVISYFIVTEEPNSD